MKFKMSTVAVLLAFVVVGCTSGGSDSNNDSGSGDTKLSQNACGTLGLGTRIVTGTECSENNSPIVEISLLLADGRQGTCTGTMITSEWVVTAAHCFFENPVQAFISASGVTAEAGTVIVHPDVRIDEKNKAVFNDVALMKLVRSVSLPTLPLVTSTAPVSGDVIDIYGYGITQDESSSNSTLGRLRSGQMRISDVSSNFVDAFYSGEGSNTCSGDSGGPAILDVNGQLGIVAILSSGDVVDCSKGDTSRFTNIQNGTNLDFITRNVPNLKVI